MKYYHEDSIANREDIERSPKDDLGPDIELKIFLRQEKNYNDNFQNEIF